MLANEVINDLINRLWINVNKIAEIPNQVFKVLELDDTMRTLYDIVFYGCLQRLIQNREIALIPHNSKSYYSISTSRWVITQIRLGGDPPDMKVQRPLISSSVDCVNDLIDIKGRRSPLVDVVRYCKIVNEQDDLALDEGA